MSAVRALGSQTASGAALATGSGAEEPTGMSIRQPDVTTLLILAGQGDPKSQDQLFRLVEGELRRLARARLRHESGSHDLQTTVLIDDAFVKLVGDKNQQWENRSQFYCYAAKVMRQLIVDDARRRDAARRGGGEPHLALDLIPELFARRSPDPLTLIALHEALTKLAASHPDLIVIVELHQFGGWTLKQIAEDILHIPYRTIKKRWENARARLKREMDPDNADA
jgi:RNA polymerase sigma factor (TIGR02999 family)